MSQEKLSFYAVSAPAGSGKTTTAIEYAVKQANQGQLIIFAVPSLKKTTEVFNSITNHSNTIRQERQVREPYNFDQPFNVDVVTSERASNNIEKSITEAMGRQLTAKRNKLMGGIIIVTHQGLLLSNKIALQDRKPFHLIWDEATTIIHHIEGNIQDKMKSALLDGILDVIETKTDNAIIYTGKVSWTAGETLKERLDQSGIGIRDSEEVQAITKHLLNASMGFCDIHLGGNINNYVSMVFIYNHLKFSGYQSTTFLGACLELTNLYQWFSMKGVEWKEHPYRGFKSVSNTPHLFRLNLYYGNQDHKHSNNFLDKKDDNDKTYRDLFVEKSIEHIDDLQVDKALVMANKNDTTSYPSGRFTLCQWNCEGLNEYKDYHCGLYVGAFNQHPAYYSLIEKLGIVDYSASLHLYQFLMRMAGRDWSFQGSINLFIPCLSLFEPLRDRFRNIDIISLGLEFEECQDGRKNNQVPTLDWYVVDKRVLRNKYGFRYKSSNKQYIKWFSSFGYKSETIEIEYRDSSRHTRIRRHQVVYKNEKGLEQAKKNFGVSH